MVLEATKEYASPELFDILKSYKREGTLSKKQLTRDLWLKPEQAKELGYNQGEEDFLLTPGEITEDAIAGRLPQPTIEPQLPITSQLPAELVDLLKKVYGGTDVSFTPDTIIKQAQESPEDFLVDLQAKGKTSETIQLLQSLSVEPLDEATVNEFFAQFTPFQQALLKALPTTVKLPSGGGRGTLGWATKYYGENPDKLRRELITAGRNADTEALVKSLYPEITDRGLKD